MFRLIFLMYLLVPTFSESSSKLIIDIEDANLNVPQLLTKYKYPHEEHKVTTDDGYILTLHRILSKKKSDGSKKSQPKVVYLNHGLYGGSFNWILNGPNISLGYLLATRGYDVWMMNNRGNSYSLNRSVDTKENYWSFDINEMSIYDAPAGIDYILDTTGQTDLTFIGHSQGCTIFFAMISEKPEYEAKINKFIALAPVVSMKYINLRFQLPKQIFDIDKLHLLERSGSFNIAPYLRIFTNLCTKNVINRICKFILVFVQGWIPRDMPAEFLTVLFGHTPDGASSKNLLQVLHWFGKDDIGKFDYGPIQNVRRYLQKDVPTYDLGSVNVPKYIFYGGKDNVILPSATEHGIARMRNVKNVTRIGKFSHIDFTHGVHVKKYINKKIFKILKGIY